jgi:hypothetical protein
MFKPITGAIDSDPSTQKRILVHLISNGGALSFVDACQEYKAVTGNVLPVKALVLDSGPGKFDREGSYYAMSQGFPKGIMYYPIAATVYLLLFGWQISRALFGTTTLLEQSGARLNDGELVDKEAKRLYVYSEQDRVVGWEAVEEHANEAKEKGIEVKMTKFEGSAHVQHMLTSADKYWKLVAELWNSVKTIASK